jgi:hypothetical protein
VALSAPYSYAPMFMAVWVVIGIGMMFWVQAKNPGAIDAVAHIHLDEEAE